MIRICAWCKKYMGQTDRGNWSKTTHTICPECKKMMQKDLEDLREKPALEPLDTYDLIEH